MSDEEKDTLREHLRKIGRSRSAKKLAALAVTRQKAIEAKKKRRELAESKRG